MSRLALFLALAAPFMAHAQPAVGDAPSIEPEGGGSLRTFLVGVRPVRSLSPSGEPFGLGVLDARLRFAASIGALLTVDIEPELYAATQRPPLGMSPFEPLGPLPAPLGLGVPAAFPYARTAGLSWTLADDPQAYVVARLDRFALKASLLFVDVTVGRQPVSLGQLRIFAPFDLAAPFPPLALDREVKPGVDALRADIFLGPTGQLTFAAVHGGEGIEAEDALLVAHATQTLLGIDISGFAASAFGDPVVGAGLSSTRFGVGLRAEATATFPRGEAPFVRAAAGVVGSVLNVAVLAEVYHQSFGADAPAGYEELARSPRFQRGELWLLARNYAALEAEIALGPAWTFSFRSLANLDDASWLLWPALAWEAADNVEVVGGALIPIGDPPVGSAPRSELGALPAGSFLEAKLYL